MQWTSDPFADRLRQCGDGTPWYLNESKHDPDDQVVQLTLIDPDQQWCTPSTFLDFLDAIHHRRLLRCLLGRTPSERLRQWTPDALMRETRSPSLQDLDEALAFCDLQQFAVPNLTREKVEQIFVWMSTWEGRDPTSLTEESKAAWLNGCTEKIEYWYGNLDGLANFGNSFEWIVQAMVEREYHALARRHVSLGRLGQLGDIDVLAFLDDGRVLMVETKSSSRGITERHIERFLKRAQRFPGDVTLLLIDSDEYIQMQQRVGQLRTSIFREYHDLVSLHLLSTEGCHMYHLRENLYVADTGGGITTALRVVLQHHMSLQSR